MAVFTQPAACEIHARADHPHVHEATEYVLVSRAAPQRDRYSDAKLVHARVAMEQQLIHHEPEYEWRDLELARQRLEGLPARRWQLPAQLSTGVGLVRAPRVIEREVEHVRHASELA